jgi:hypothetical protein
MVIPKQLKEKNNPSPKKGFLFTNFGDEITFILWKHPKLLM